MDSGGGLLEVISGNSSSVDDVGSSLVAIRTNVLARLDVASESYWLSIEQRLLHLFVGLENFRLAVFESSVGNLVEGTLDRLRVRRRRVVVRDVSVVEENRFVRENVLSNVVPPEVRPGLLQRSL